MRKPNCRPYRPMMRRSKQKSPYSDDMYSFSGFCLCRRVRKEREIRDESKGGKTRTFLRRWFEVVILRTPLFALSLTLHRDSASGSRSPVETETTERTKQKSEPP